MILIIVLMCLALLIAGSLIYRVYKHKPPFKEKIVDYFLIFSAVLIFGTLFSMLLKMA